ncbi:type II secretion system F family protein [Marinomonas sp. TW1]|uniref:type II secretion system F family protein n=1 Tax=Marinomonas sp. TW1 TaxID=1561203 RepID=UPI0007AF5CDD|nr:type II secretion system F family protein [Marinomonas sp. TW1]KZN12257.1 pilus assembly protein [Marinomonas sp. TW1]
MKDDMILPVALGLFLCAIGMILLALYLRTKSKTLTERLSSYRDKESIATHQVSLLIEENEASWWRKYLHPLDRIGRELAGTESDRFATKKLLLMAGLRHSQSLGLYTFGKLALGLLLSIGFVFLVLEKGDRLTLSGLAGSLIILFLSSIGAEIWLKMRATSRGGRLSSSLPDALDLMVICAEAGLPLGRIFKTVSKELAFSSPELAEEIGYTYAELQIISDRTQALKNLADRCGVDNVAAMVSTLIQAERYGTPLSQALRTISVESRKNLVLELEEKAGKLPAQLSVPLMVFILPPVIAMMGTPAMIRIIRMLGS